MVISHSHSQPLLGRHGADYDNERDHLSVAGRGAASSSDGSRLPSGSALRTHSCEDMLLGGSRGDADAYFKRCHTAPGYVSFEDVIGTKEFREGSGRPPEAGISDPLVRTASRLYSRVHVRRYRRQSPGPLGTRRGGAMLRFVKKYVSPCVAFVACVFCCVPIPGAAAP